MLPLCLGWKDQTLESLDLLFSGLKGLLESSQMENLTSCSIKPFGALDQRASRLRSKRHGCLNEQRVCFSPEMFLLNSLIFTEHFSDDFSNTLKLLCIVFSVGNEVFGF